MLFVHGASSFNAESLQECFHRTACLAGARGLRVPMLCECPEWSLCELPAVERFPLSPGTARPSAWRNVDSHSPCWATAEALVREIGHRDSAKGARVVWSSSSGYGRDGVKNVHWAGRDFGQPAFPRTTSLSWG